MKIFTQSDLRTMERQNKAAAEAIADDGDTPDMQPVVKIFDPTGAATWLLSEYDPETRMFFGLADLGMGCPELGYVSRDDLEGARGRRGLPLERDLHFTPSKTLREYAEEARAAGSIAA